MQSLSRIITIIYDRDESIKANCNYFSEFVAKYFQLSGLNVKIISNIPNTVVEKMDYINNNYVFESDNLKVTYDVTENVDYFHYLQKFKAESIYQVIENMCSFNPELALPVTFINAKKTSDFYHNANNFNKNGYLIYESDEEFFNNEVFQNLNDLQKEIVLFARDIYGNFVLSNPRNSENKYFSALSLSLMGRLVNDELTRDRIIGIHNDILTEQDFLDYYETLANPLVKVEDNSLKRILDK